MALQAKAISYRVIEVMPGIGQMNVFRLSGQRQVPVIVDNGNIIADSSEIIKYLEGIEAEPKLFPNDPKEAAQAHIIEDWADTTLAKAARRALLQAAAIDEDLRVALLPDELPASLKQIIGGIPCQFINEISDLVNNEQEASLLESLEKLSSLVNTKKWLVGNELSIADLAVAAQLSLIKFPTSSGIRLANKGCKGFSDNPILKNLFDWRDQLEIDLMEFSSAGS